jgi:deoxyribonuclease IV
MRLGVHVSTAGGLPLAIERAREIGCEALQVFARNQRQWSPRPLDPDEAAAFRRAAREAGYLATAVSHASYLINPSALDATFLERSRNALVDEIDRCAQLGIPYLCVHPGAHMGAGEEAGLALAAASVRFALDATRGRRVAVLLECTAGQGTSLGHRLEHLATLLSLLPRRRTGVCLDTCHLFAAGYDLRTAKGYERTMRAVEETVGLSRVRAWHLNDSVQPRGARRDRHTHIGEGRIGKQAFRRLVNDPRFEALPGLLETPGEPEDDRRNLDLLRKMRRR